MFSLGICSGRGELGILKPPAFLQIQLIKKMARLSSGTRPSLWLLLLSRKKSFMEAWEDICGSSPEPTAKLKRKL